MNITLNNSRRVNSFNKSDDIKNNKSKNTSSQLKALMKQREEIQRQMKELQKNTAANKIKNAGSKTKIQGGRDPSADQLKQLQKQLADIDKQIAQVKTDNINKTVNEGRHKLNISDDDKKQDLEKMFLGFSRNMKNEGIQKSVRRKLQDSSRILETEIKLDKSRGVNTSRKEKLLSNMKKNIEKINNNLDNKFEKTNKNQRSEKVKKIISEKLNLKNDKQFKKTEEAINKMIKNDNNLKGNLVDARV